MIIEYCDKILMEHRKDSETWAIIGGGLWIDETLYECAKREVLEETGIQLFDKMVEFYKIYDDPSRIASYPNGNVLRVITIVYRVKLTVLPSLRCSNKSKELRFFSKNELQSIKVANTHIPIIQDYINEI